MNIGIVIPGFSDGEQDWCIPVYLNLVRELAHHEQVRVFAMRYPSRRDEYAVYGAKVFAIGGHSSTAGIARVGLIARTIRAILRQHYVQPFDVLHAIWADETGVAAWLAGRLIGVPVVVSVAGGELAALPGYGLQSGTVSRWLVRWALSHANSVTVPSHYIASLIRQQHIRTAPLALLPLGVDTTLFAVPTLPRAETRLLTVGSLSPVKGQDRIIAALEQLPGLRLDIVGEGPSLAELRSLCDTHHVADRVTFHGAVRHDLLPRFYQSDTLLVLPSRHEAFGMVVIEAAACGLPTVGFDLGVVSDFPGAVPVPPDDVNALAATIRALIDDPARRQRLSQEGRAEVEARYTIRAMSEGFRRLYAGLQR